MFRKIIAFIWAQPQDPLDQAFAIIETKEETPQEETEKVAEYTCFNKTGEVTKTKHNCFVIDGHYTYISDEDHFVVGNKVSYDLFKDRNVFKVTNVKLLDEWNDDLTPEQKKKWCMRTEIGEVYKREGRLIFIKPNDVKVNLNTVSSEFIPKVGDWVEYDIKAEIDENVTNLNGKILDVTKIRPLRTKIVKGAIRNFNKNDFTGLIEREVFFDRESLSEGYLPRVGDRIIAEAIESTQGSCLWRALTVILQNSLQKNVNFLELKVPKLLNYKMNIEGIFITDDLNVDTYKFNDDFKMPVIIRNDNFPTVNLIDIKFDSQISQVTLTEDFKPQTLLKEGLITITFSINAKTIGKSVEVVVFIFDKFIIGRNITINLHPDNRNVPNKPYKRDLNHINQMRDFRNKSDVQTIRGERINVAPRFVGGRMGEYKIPDEIWHIFLKYDDRSSNNRNIYHELVKARPCLEDGMHMKYYEERLHTLLYIEEIECVIAMRKYDNPQTCFIRNGQFLMLEVENLAEKRPSIIIGDKIIAINPFQPTSTFEGFVHKVSAKHIFLKFSTIMHNTYQGEDYAVHAVQSRVPIRKLHHAVHLAMRNLGRDFLFPTRVVSRQPQVKFTYDEYWDDTNEKIEAKRKSDEALEITESLNASLTSKIKLDDQKNCSTPQMKLINPNRVVEQKGLSITVMVKPPSNDCADNLDATSLSAQTRNENIVPELKTVQNENENSLSKLKNVESENEKLESTQNNVAGINTQISTSSLQKTIEGNANGSKQDDKNVASASSSSTDISMKSISSNETCKDMCSTKQYSRSSKKILEMAKEKIRKDSLNQQSSNDISTNNLNTSAEEDAADEKVLSPPMKNSLEDILRMAKEKIRKDRERVSNSSNTSLISNASNTSLDSNTTDCSNADSEESGTANVVKKSPIAHKTTKEKLKIIQHIIEERKRQEETVEKMNAEGAQQHLTMSPQEECKRQEETIKVQRQEICNKERMKKDFEKVQKYKQKKMVFEVLNPWVEENKLPNKIVHKGEACAKMKNTIKSDLELLDNGMQKNSIKSDFKLLDNGMQKNSIKSDFELLDNGMQKNSIKSDLELIDNGMQKNATKTNSEVAKNEISGDVKQKNTTEVTENLKKELLCTHNNSQNVIKLDDGIQKTNENIVFNKQTENNTQIQKTNGNTVYNKQPENIRNTEIHKANENTVFNKQSENIRNTLTSTKNNRSKNSSFSQRYNNYVQGNNHNRTNNNNRAIKYADQQTEEVVNAAFKLTWYDQSLNYYQKEAVRNILLGEARPLPYIIFGPPGTGKTVTVIESILQIIRMIPHSRILVGAPSNSAADIIATRLIDSGCFKPGDLVRFVSYKSVLEDSIPQKLVPYSATGSISREGTMSDEPMAMENGLTLGCTLSVIGRHRVTIGTCSALGTLHNMGFTKGHFTHIIVDEAGQCTEPEIMIPLVFLDIKQGQCILSGDPMQLGPVINSRQASEFGLGDSFLERLLHRFPYVRDVKGFNTCGGYDPRLITCLVYNYRSLPGIINLSNRLFYHSELRATLSDKTSEEALYIQKLRSILPAPDGKIASLIFHGLDSQNFQGEDSPSWFNPGEAGQVFYYVNEFYRLGVKSSEIGIISPYNKQVKQIRSILIEAGFDIPKVGTVEEFQGNEFNVIILSTVRSNADLINNDVTHSLGFISNPKRLNVALTRARCLCIVVGNPFLLSHDPYWRSLILHCIDNRSYIGCVLNPKK